MVPFWVFRAFGVEDRFVCCHPLGFGLLVVRGWWCIFGTAFLFLACAVVDASLWMVYYYFSVSASALASASASALALVLCSREGKRRVAGSLEERSWSLL